MRTSHGRRCRGTAPRPWVRSLGAAGALVAIGLLVAFAYHRGEVTAGVDAAQIALERRGFDDKIRRLEDEP